MLSSVLNSERAVEVNIAIIRAFIKMRQLIAGNKDLAQRLNEIEKRYNAQFKVVFNSIRELALPLVPPTFCIAINYRAAVKEVSSQDRNNCAA